jgi:hydroxypyruvate isomerase
VFKLAVCADTVFLDLPFDERVRRISDAGFQVEFWTWQHHLQELEALAGEPGIDFNAFTGYLKGAIVDPEGADAFLDGCRRTLPIAEMLDCKTLVLSTGELGPNGEVIHSIPSHAGRRWISAYRTLTRIAELGEEHGVTYVLEHLNTKVDHPGFLLPHVEDSAELVAAVGSPNLRLMFDVYHAQVQEGNVLQLIRDFGHLFGNVHLADVPGRHEPGTGELMYGRVIDELRAVGYRGAITLEAYPERSDELALERFSSLFASVNG